MHGLLAPSSSKTLVSTPIVIKQFSNSKTQSQPRALTVAKSNSPILKNAVIGIASAAALAGAALVLVRSNSFRSPSSTSQAPPIESSSNNRNNSSKKPITSIFNSLLQHQLQYQQSNTTNTKPRWMQLGWKRSTDAELALIEAKRAREAAYELESWDKRWKLRKKTLPELRQMAAYVY
jgi:hypothetical protein